MNRFEKALLALLLLIVSASVSPAQNDPDAKLKVKTKNGVTRVQDKSKPVRAALEAEYAKMRQAYFDDDPEPVVATRAPDYAAKMPDGKVWTRDDVVVYIRAGFDQVKQTLELSFDI